MASLLRGRKLLRQDGSTATAEELAGKVVLLYFSASWCPPCHRFTPVLADFYDEVTAAGGNLEIVFASSDRSAGEMMQYFRELHGDWLALDLSEAAAIRELSERYRVSGIPTLVAIQCDGTVIDAECRDKVQTRGPRAFEEWKAALKAPAFSGNAQRLGGGSGVSRLVAGGSGASSGGASNGAAAGGAVGGGYDEDAAMAEAMAASMSEPSAPAAASAAYDEDAAVAAAMAASLQTATLARTTSPSVELARLKSDEERERRRAAQLSAAADTADATATHAELRATTAEAQYLKIDAAVSRMTEANAESVTRTATALLLKILSNIQKRPEELKYRRIRKENKQISGGVLVARGALALLTAVGFEPAEEGFLMMAGESVDPSLLAHAIASLESLIAGRATAANAAREAHLAKLRAEAGEAKAARDRLVAAVQEDTQARKGPGWKASAFEKGGKDITRFEDIGVDLNAGGG